MGGGGVRNRAGSRPICAQIMHGIPREIKLLFHFRCKAAQSGANRLTETLTEVFPGPAGLAPSVIVRSFLNSLRQQFPASKGGAEHKGAKASNGRVFWGSMG